MKFYESQVIYLIELLYKMTYTCSSNKWNIILLLKGKVFILRKLYASNKKTRKNTRSPQEK